MKGASDNDNTGLLTLAIEEINTLLDVGNKKKSSLKISRKNSRSS
jgi:hypothetical protein